MPLRVFLDTVTLRHFGAVGKLDVVQYVYSSTAQPRWTSEAREEVLRHRGEVGCNEVLGKAATWLGAPAEPGPGDHAHINQILLGLARGKPNPKDAGEAEAIHFAESCDADFVTDDGPAYDFAAKRLGAHRVRDTVHILRAAVADGYMAAIDASGLCVQMEQKQRFLRAIHRDHLRQAAYFT